jgi:hypothetical protein
MRSKASREGSFITPCPRLQLLPRSRLQLLQTSSRNYSIPPPPTSSSFSAPVDPPRIIAEEKVRFPLTDPTLPILLSSRLSNRLPGSCHGLVVVGRLDVEEEEQVAKIDLPAPSPPRTSAGSTAASVPSASAACSAGICRDTQVSTRYIQRKNKKDDGHKFTFMHLSLSHSIQKKKKIEEPCSLWVLATSLRLDVCVRGHWRTYNALIKKHPLSALSMGSPSVCFISYNIQLKLH